MVVVEGDTTTVMDGAVPLNAAPLERVPLMLPLPVTVSVNVALMPLQILVVPVMTAVGLGFTVTKAVPVRSPGNAVQLASVREVMA